MRSRRREKLNAGRSRRSCAPAPPNSARRQRKTGADPQPAHRDDRAKAAGTDKQLAKSSLSDGFEFNAYARSGMLVNSHGKGARGGPGISPASSLNGDAHVGRLGNEKITT
jgi:sucrose porin